MPNERLKKFFRPSQAQLVVAIALALVAAATVLQLRETTMTTRFASMSRTDLIALLDGLNTESKRLSGEISQLETTRDELQSGADAAEAAHQQAQRRADSLGILAGTLPAQGPGIEMVISAPNNRISPDLLLEGIEELRDAGAEAIEVNGTIRVVANSWVGSTSDGLTIDNAVVSLPITIDAIGDSHALAEGARFRGGFVSQLEADKVGASVQINQRTQVKIEALHQVKQPQFARPA